MRVCRRARLCADDESESPNRSEEHTSELQSQSNLVCRLLLEKKKQEDLAPRDRRGHQGDDYARSGPGGGAGRRGAALAGAHEPPRDRAILHADWRRVVDLAVA